jgi:hypothetical protein
MARTWSFKKANNDNEPKKERDCCVHEYMNVDAGCALYRRYMRWGGTTSTSLAVGSSTRESADVVYATQKLSES